MSQNLHVIARPISLPDLQQLVEPWVADGARAPLVIVLDNFRQEEPLSIAHLEKALADAREATRAAREIVMFVAPGMMAAIRDGTGPVSAAARTSLVELAGYAQIHPYNGTRGGLEDAINSRLPLRINQSEPTTSEEARRRVAERERDYGHAAAAAEALEGVEPTGDSAVAPRGETFLQDLERRKRALDRARRVEQELLRRERRLGRVALAHDADTPQAANAQHGEAAAYASTIASLANCPPEAYPLVLALSGPWGVGKSTIIAGLLDRLTTTAHSRHLKVLQHNAWAHRDADRADAALLSDLATQLQPEFWQASWRFVAWPQRLAGAAVLAFACVAILWVTLPPEAWGWALPATLLVTIAGTFVLLQPMMDFVARFVADPEKAAGRGRVAATSRRWDRLVRRRLGPKARLVIVLEDLDRCSATHALQVVGVSQQVLTKPGTLIVLVGDMEVIGTGIGVAWSTEALPGQHPNPLHTGLDFLQKIVQLHIEVPRRAWTTNRLPTTVKDDQPDRNLPRRHSVHPPPDSATSDRAENGARQMSQDETLEELVGFALSGGFATPRMAKRVANRIRLELSLHHELAREMGQLGPPPVSGYAVAKWAALAERFPALWLTVTRTPALLQRLEDASPEDAPRLLATHVDDREADAVFQFLTAEPLLSPALPGLLRICARPDASPDQTPGSTGAMA